MALLKCPDCGHNVSDQAEICPGCGYPVNKIKTGTTDQKTKSLSRNVCPSCGMLLGTDESLCHNCGKFISLQQQQLQGAVKAKKHSSAGPEVATVIFVIFIAIIALHLFGVFDAP